MTSSQSAILGRIKNNKILTWQGTPLISLSDEEILSHLDLIVQENSESSDVAQQTEIEEIFNANVDLWGDEDQIPEGELNIALAKKIMEQFGIDLERHCVADKEISFTRNLELVKSVQRGNRWTLKDGKLKILVDMRLYWANKRVLNSNSQNHDVLEAARQIIIQKILNDLQDISPRAYKYMSRIFQPTNTDLTEWQPENIGYLIIRIKNLMKLIVRN